MVASRLVFTENFFNKKKTTLLIFRIDFVLKELLNRKLKNRNILNK